MNESVKDNKPKMRTAKPVWRKTPPIETKNDSLQFHTEFDWQKGQNAKLRIAGHTTYRIFLNNNLIHYGPARAPKQFARIEVIKLNQYLNPGHQLLEIQVISYGIETFSNMLQPPFLQAEIEIDGKIVAATDPNSDKIAKFDASEVSGRIQRTQRFSYMRSFAEARKLDPICKKLKVELARADTENLKLLPRRVPIETATYVPLPLPDLFLKILEEADPSAPTPEFLSQMRREENGFKFSELESKASQEYAALTMKLDSQRVHNSRILEKQPINLSRNQAGISQNSTVRSGLFGIAFSAKQTSRIIIALDSLPGKALYELDQIRPQKEQANPKVALPAPAWLNPYRENCVNLIEIWCEPGKHEFWTEEPFVWSHSLIAVLEGEIAIDQVQLFPIERPTKSTIEISTQIGQFDPELVPIFEAGLNSLRMNSFDLYTDTTRERGGYLCDSFFTAAAGAEFLNDLETEIAFIENFAVAESFDGIPDGMIPMCYPSDALGGTFIPQWPMWFLIHLEDFSTRGGSKNVIAPLQSKFEKFFEWLGSYLNDLNLIANLPGWNFVEHSEANAHIGDVNFPTNILLAASLRSFQKCFSAYPEAFTSPDSIASNPHNLFWNGIQYRDAAFRTETGYELDSFSSAIAQHFPYFFGFRSADPQDPHFQTLIQADYLHKLSTKQLDQAQMVLFPGLFIRWHLLVEWEEYDLFVQEIKTVLGPQAKLTGSIWETNFGSVRNSHIPESWDFGYPWGYSCSHGFGSYICILLKRIIEKQPRNRVLRRKKTNTD